MSFQIRPYRPDDLDWVLAANAIARRAYEKAGFLPYAVMYERSLRPDPNEE